MTTLRCFVAVDLPSDLKQQLTDLISSLKSAATSNSIRWVRPDGIHLTLKFLGEVPAERQGEIEAATTAALANPQTKPFELTAGGLGVFPKPSQPRVIWVGLSGNLQALAHLQKQVETALAHIGFPPESRAFSPHLTLGRVPDLSLEEKQRIGQFIQNYPVKSELARFEVNEAVLMESILRPEGAIYRPLTHFKFGGNLGFK